MCVASRERVQKTCQLTPLQNTADHGAGAQRPQSVTPTPAPYLKAPLKTNGSSVCCVAPGTSHSLENKHSELRRRRKEATSITSLPEPHGAATGGGEGHVPGPLAAGTAGAAFPQQVRAAGGDGVSPALWPRASSSRSPVTRRTLSSVTAAFSGLCSGTAVLAPARLCCPFHRSSVTALARGHGDRGSWWQMTADAVGRAEGQ